MLARSLVIDASVFISAFLANERFHEQSQTFLLGLASSRIHMSSYGLWELSAALFRRTGNRTATDRAMKLILELVSDHHLFDSASCQTHFPEKLYSTALRAADFVYVSLALYTGSTLVTLDDEMLERAASVVTVVRPEAFA